MRDLEYIGTTSKYVRNFKEYRAWIAKHFCKNWITATTEHLFKTHGDNGKPIGFPARVWLVLLWGQDWGSQIQVVNFMTKKEFYK